MRYWSAIISFVWTGWVFGVEFGPARVQTGVGEPLEIRLSIVNLGELQSTQLFPLLAAESAFTAQGIQRLEVLSELTYIIDVNEKEIDLHSLQSPTNVNHSLSSSGEESTRTIRVN